MTKYFQVDKGYYNLKIYPEKKALKLPVLLDISANSQVEAELKVNELEEFLKNIFYERITTEDISISEDEIQNQINGLFFKVMNFMNVDKEIIVSERLIISNIKYYLDIIIKLNELQPRANEIRFSRVVNKSNKNNYHISGDASLNTVLFDTAIKYNYSELTEFTENQTSYYYQDLNQLDPFNLGQMNDYLKEILVLHRRAMSQTNLSATFVNLILSYLQESTIIKVNPERKSSGEQYEIAYDFLSIFNLFKSENHFNKRTKVDYIKILLKNYKK